MKKQLIGRRVLLRPLQIGDFEAWSNVRIKNSDWLTKWEPLPGSDQDPTLDKSAFALRCSARDRDWHTGIGFGFGVFVDGEFVGEVNLNSVQRGPFQNCQIGYWIAETSAGQGYIPESLVLAIEFALMDLALHRVEVAIVPRNLASLRVVEKLGLRNEGTARRFLEINGIWEDHVRYGVTIEDWHVMREDLLAQWIR